MPRHLRIALVMCVFGLLGAALSVLGPKRPAIASGAAIGVTAGGELTCRRIVKVGPLGIGARCVPTASRIAASD